MNELEHLSVDLTGRNLIEASAGTGKTYAIACLYLRLLVERNLSPEQILVVTYTEAATEELRGRIRSRIREALDVFEGGEPKDAFISGLVTNINGTGPDRAEAQDRLERALTSFDLASIFTIHGFCLRALQDNAFESGFLSDTELVTDQSALIQEVVDDFWRRHFFAEYAPLLGYALRHKLTPDYMTGFLKGMLGNPKLQILPDFDLDQLTTLGQECQRAFEAVKSMWQERSAEIRDLIVNNKGLSRSLDYYKPEKLPDLFAAMESYCAVGNPYDLFAEFEKLTASGILAGKKPTGEALRDPFFDLCEIMQQLVVRRFLAFRSELIAFARTRMASRKRELNIRFFDDLLTDLYAALYGARGDELAASLSQKYRAALIDEFQDTDPVQYDIFRQIYADPACPLFLIGDPKQAIYSFRGADIFAYLQAAAGVDDPTRSFTLTDNWRSTPGLLSAFNTLFRDDIAPFVFNHITYHQVTSGKGDGYDPLSLKDADDAPLQVWYLPAGLDGKDSNVGRANREIPIAVAAEIARLLEDGREGRAHIDDRPLAPEDIAVIVRSHRQAASIQDALRKLGIPSVMRSDKSIFSTDEAREVCTLLAALADPGSETRIRAALVTRLLGLSGNDIATLLDDEPLWEEWLIKFRDYHHIWLEHGFMVMVQTLLAREGVRGRLLRHPDGERALTNVLHCCEILHAACHARGLGAAGVVTWFSERVSGEEAADEYQIRLETDEKAVKILTVHVSKGLEFPIVFCPYLWVGVRSDDEIVTFHDENRTLIKDFGSVDKKNHALIARKEALAENLRLLYVALTRAKLRCYLVAGKITDSTGRNRPETSALAYLFHASKEVRGADDLVAALAQEVKKLPAETMVAQLQELAARDEGTISVSAMPAEEDAPHYLPMYADGAQLACRTFSGSIDRSWRISSFTSFAAHDTATVELPDRDEADSGESALAAAAADQTSQVKSIFTFPRGAHAGIFLHELFEKLDFTDMSSAENRKLLTICLQKHGFNTEWHPHITAMVENVVTTRLAAPEGSFSLSELKKGSWITELEFFFPLRFITSATLQDTFRCWSGQHTTVDLMALSRALKFKPAEGMVRGFIDMVFEQNGRFYLADWKSNHLGYRIEEYGRDQLRAAMVKKLYSLQYLLYTVALNRYLSLRIKGYDYTRHFGGVLFVFLRGANQKRGEEFGFFRDLPPLELINELTNCLIQAGG
ncbi:MAG TPA: exodeoxyribonuclease V subunit beta [Desulfuromonadales bacterium]|nr:exodeoxyribonuclease V subunit beta [Desulfuromonadales bacterium]